jgi:hypothetical protein
MNTISEGSRRRPLRRGGASALLLCEAQIASPFAAIPVQGWQAYRKGPGARACAGYLLHFQRERTRVIP